MSNHELQRLLRSLPTVKANDNLEERLGQAIAQRGSQLPQVLGSLPMIPAHEDFDARLMQAIRDRPRRIIPPLGGISAGASLGWMRWLTSAVVVGGLLFGFLNIGELSPVARSGGASSVGTPTPVTVAQRTPRATVVKRMAPVEREGMKSSILLMQVAIPSASSIVPVTTLSMTSTGPGARIVRIHSRPSAPLLDLPLNPSMTIPGPPTTLPEAYSHTVIYPAQPTPEPAATGPDFRDEPSSILEEDSDTRLPR